ncbi:MAG TPA: right-handed parallel beta-helix repeat-containing protein, partial [Thermoanaerobaculia bacterium]|nr:right-handed parallel beta-helix repeat-containing protein [Thermoanaerobaculia bacterium]
RLTGEWAPGLDINSANNTIKGLQINGFQSPAIVLQGSGGNVIGGDRSRGSAILGEANIIYGYQFTGIASSSASNLIIGNQIGTDPSGLPAPGGQRRGIGIYQSSPGPVDGGDRIEGNVIAGNIDAEIYLQNARGNTIIGNFLGTDAGGTARVGAAFQSIASSFAADNLITGNVIANMVNLTDPGSYCNRVTNNWIGVARNGSSLTSQGQWAGVSIREPFNLVSENVLDIVGVAGLYSRTSDTVIMGNTVGAESRQALSGIHVSAASRTFIEGNSVYASPRGIWLESGVSATFISRNTIMGNDDGISIDAADTSVIQENVIARNGGAGVVVSSPTHRIRRNSIFENATAPIAITTGAPVPQPPSITSVTLSAVEGSACSGCTVEIFSDSGSQGRRYEGSVVAAASGKFTFTGAVAGPNVTATATEADGSTSAFSLPAARPPSPPRRRAVRH